MKEDWRADTKTGIVENKKLVFRPMVQRMLKDAEYFKAKRGIEIEH